MHGDPVYTGARSAWMWIGDAMGAALVIWRIAGLIMRRSVRATPVAGGVALGSGVTLMSVLVLSPWIVLVMA